jgi:CubicO group peptidase (beta-lactamase class C family)
MVSGLEFSETPGRPLSDVTRMLMLEPDAAAFAAAKPLAAKPGTRWAYASGTTNIISRIIRHRLGEAEYRAFPRRALFEPLGMDSAVLEADASGTFVGSSFLYATARDWAKFGQLYLQDGVWQGRRILPEGWVAYSSQPTPQAAGGEYAAHFWLDIAAEYRLTDPGPPLPPGAFHAMGYEGQCVSIVPSHGLVVVRLGLTRTAAAWRQDRFIQRIITALGGA